MKAKPRLIYFTYVMSEEYEVIRTDAPNELIEEQLRLNCKREMEGETVQSYDLLEEKGYTVELVGSHMSVHDMPSGIDATFDWLDYYD